MLSIGTGRNVRDNDMTQARKSNRDITDTSSVTSMSPIKPTGSPFQSKSVKNADKFDDHQKCGRTWDKFIAGRITPESAGSEHNGRYTRISPELNIATPRLDDIQRFDELRRESGEVLEQNTSQVREVAHRLIASTFFFEEGLGSMKQTTSGYTCKGKLADSLEALSTDLNQDPYFAGSEVRLMK